MTAFSASTPADGFTTTKAHWYQVDVSSGTPTLVQEGLIDPGPGVATFFPSAAQDAAGQHRHHLHGVVLDRVRLGLRGRPRAGSPWGAPSRHGLRAGWRLHARELPRGRLQHVVLDPTDGMTFWAANEYIGTDGTQRYLEDENRQILDLPACRPSLRFRSATYLCPRATRARLQLQLHRQPVGLELADHHRAVHHRGRDGDIGQGQEQLITPRRVAPSTFNPGQTTQTDHDPGQGRHDTGAKRDLLRQPSTRSTPRSPMARARVRSSTTTACSRAAACFSPAVTPQVSLRTPTPLVKLTFGGQSDRSQGGLDEHIEALVWDQIMPQKHRRSATA